MKISLITCIFFFLLLTLAGMQSTAQVRITSVDSQSLYSYQWNLFWMKDANLYKVDWSQFPNLLFYPGLPGKVVGASGCKSLECEFAISEEDKIRFFNMAHKHDGCEISDVDGKFLIALHKTDRFRIKQNELRLYGDGILLARFFPEITHLAHYKMPGLEGEWNLDYLLGPNNAIVNMDRTFPNGMPTIIFTGSKPDTVTGFTGCNAYISNYEIRTSSLRFISSAKVSVDSCSTIGEEAFLNALSLVTNYWVGNDVLYFWKGKQAVLMFSRKTTSEMEGGAAVRFINRKNKRTIYVCGNQ